jgi:hypothetical protein
MLCFDDYFLEEEEEEVDDEEELGKKKTVQVMKYRYDPKMINVRLICLPKLFIY